MKTFTFYWGGGTRTVYQGNTPADALNRAGYGGGAVRALDFYAEGNNTEYVWRDKQWKKEGDA